MSGLIQKISDSHLSSDVDTDLIKILELNELIRRNPEMQDRFWRKMIKILKSYPPAKNENKFLYGKIGEISFINDIIKKLFPESVELDEAVSMGSCYMNDVSVRDKGYKLDLSIKITKNISSIILINKNSSLPDDKYNIMDCCVILINIKLMSIFILPISIVKEYLKYTGPNIKLRSAVWKYILKNHPEFICKFHMTRVELEKKYPELQEINEKKIYEKLYSEL